MAPMKFNIVLDNNVGSYFPGQMVTGKVILELDQEKNSQGLKLKFNGEALVEWRESQSQGGSKGYHGKETYFHYKIVLMGDEKNTDISIPAGYHEYPFSFELPLNIPSSFESSLGNVRYGLEAIVKRSWKFDYNTKTLFTVNALVDLNSLPVYMEPREVSKEKSICCLCCKQGPIAMKVEIPRTGYVPGEFVKFSVFASNSSSRPVTGIVVYLVRDIVYHASGCSKYVTEEIAKVKGPEVQPFLSETWQDHVQLPPVPPTNLGGCKIIDVTYLLKIKLDIPSSIDLKKKVPLMIGTIPFTSFLPESQQMPSLYGANQETVFPTQPPSIVPTAPPLPMPPLFSQYSNMPFPLYQDAAAFGKGSDDKIDNEPPYPPSSDGDIPVPGDKEYRFTPKYATYNYGWKFELNVADQNGVN